LDGESFIHTRTLHDQDEENEDTSLDFIIHRMDNLNSASPLRSSSSHPIPSASIDIVQEHSSKTIHAPEKKSTYWMHLVFWGVRLLYVLLSTQQARQVAQSPVKKWAQRIIAGKSNGKNHTSTMHVM
jgi:hypothetical protein